MILQILLTFLPILLVVAIFVIGISWYMARSSLVPTKTPKTETPQDYHIAYEDFTVERDGIRLKAWFIPAPQELLRKTRKAPTIVLTHGWGRSAQQMLPYAQFLHKAGFHLILYDVRGHGDSDPVEFVTISRIVADLDSMIDYAVNRPEVDSRAVGLFGHSMGAAASILQAGRDSRVRAVASSSGFADFADLTTQMLRWRRLPAFPFRFLIQKFWEKRAGVALSSVNPIEQIKNVSVPVLLLHGDQDRVVTPDQLEKLFQNANSAETYVINGKNHSGLFEDPIYREKVVAFFNQALKSEQAKTV
ncbi:MAG: alpha/beta hydrolase [bacterium]